LAVAASAEEPRTPLVVAVGLVELLEIVGEGRS
jgi:hypothetical protein